MRTSINPIFIILIVMYLPYCYDLSKPKNLSSVSQHYLESKEVVDTTFVNQNNILYRIIKKNYCKTIQTKENEWQQTFTYLLHDTTQIGVIPNHLLSLNVNQIAIVMNKDPLTLYNITGVIPKKYTYSIKNVHIDIDIAFIKNIIVSLLSALLIAVVVFYNRV